MKKKKTLQEAAAEILAQNLTTKGTGEPFGAGFTRPAGAQLAGKMKSDDSTDHGHFVGGPVVDPEKSGVKAATIAAPKATPPGTSPQANSDEPMLNLKAGTNHNGATRAKVDDHGIVREEDEDDMNEEGHSKIETDTTKAEPTTMEPEKGGWKGAPLAGGGEPPYGEHQLKDEKGGSSFDHACPVSDRVKSYFKGKGAGLAVSEDVDAIFAGQNLSEEFKKKARMVFEAAVISSATKVCEGMEAEYVQALQTVSEAQKNDMAVKIDEYMDYMSNKWLEENKLAVETSLRTEIAEDFMAALKNVFIEHYIDIPEDKVSVVEQMAEEIDSLSSKLNESVEKNIELAKRLNEQAKQDIVSEAVAGLTDTQASKIKSLAESVEFKGAEDFKAQVKTLTETFAKKTDVKPASLESLNEDTATPKDLKETKEIVESTSPKNSKMDRYVNAISRQVKN